MTGGPTEKRFGGLADAADIAFTLKGKTLVFGDQSPWAGGLLREWVARAELGAETRYFFQDLDTPWFETAERLAVKHGWNHYWSLACRYPWSFSVPGMEVNEVLNTTQSPHGLNYLIGPRTHGTLCAQNHCPEVLRLLAQMLDAETAWAGKLAAWADVPSGEAVDFNADSLVGVVKAFARRNGQARVECFSELFQNSPPLLRGQLPEECFWHVSTDGIRRHQSGQDTYAAPRGKALLLEFAARGWVLGCTQIPYLAETIALRDRHLPGLPVKLLYVFFDWEPAIPNPLRRVIAEHNRKKQRRGKPALDESNLRLNIIETYWRRRPSSISWQILGGRLNPRFELIAV